MRKVFTIYSKWLGWETSRRVYLDNKELTPIKTYVERYLVGNEGDHKIQGVFELPDKCVVKVIREEKYMGKKSVEEFFISVEGKSVKIPRVSDG